MKYLLLVYRDEQHWEKLSASERNAFEQACMTNNELLQKNGHLLAAEELDNNATTVSVQNGKLSLDDGSFAGIREAIVGLYLITARDLNDAIRLAAQMPQAHAGAIEVRPLVAGAISVT